MEWTFALDLHPVPAARPRVTRRGWSYYPKTYKDWMKAASEKLPKFPEPLFTKPVEVRVLFAVKRPKKTKLLTPHGDIDNFQKAIFDALTKSGIWTDDKLVASVDAKKQFSSKPGIYIAIGEA